MVSNSRNKIRQTWLKPLSRALLAEPCTYFSSPCEDRESVPCSDPGDGLGLEGLDAVRPRAPALDLAVAQLAAPALAPGEHQVLRGQRDDVRVAHRYLPFHIGQLGYSLQGNYSGL